MDIEQIVDEVVASVPARSLLAAFEGRQKDKVEQALLFAVRAHGNQRRKSGELFVYHPIAVAHILLQQQLSYETIIAGLLHDVLEDTEVTSQQMAQTFGQEITDIVEGLTKIVHIAERGDPKRDKTSTYRKLLLASTDDARVLVVKFADRLHNIRTIASMPTDRARAIAKETLDVYAPLAHRLGMSKVKEELEDSSLKVLDPHAWEEAGAVQKQWKDANGKKLQTLEATLQKELEQEGISAVVKSRVKSRRSISEKIRRQGTADETIWDVLGIRVIIDGPASQCYSALGVVHGLWRPRFDRFHDYISVPKANLYQSIHTTVYAEGVPLEVQIRTQQMDDTAEHGIAAHWLYKETLREGGPESTKRFLTHTAESQRDLTFEEAFEALRNDVFEHEVYAFTPAGEVKVLPERSTAVDFAYAVHSDIGDRCVGCRIDGALKPLSRPINNGEVIEIITSETSTPSRDWLLFVKSPKARNKIRAFYREQEQQEQIKTGLAALKTQLKAAKLAPLADEEKLEDLVMEMNYESLDDAALEAARGTERLQLLMRRITKQLARRQAGHAVKEDLQPSRRKPAANPQRHAGSSMGVLIEGEDDILVRFAACCSPEPGDKIIGYVSLARGVSVHKQSCRNMQQALREHSPRIKEASWESDNPQSFLARIEIVAVDRPGYVAELTGLITQSGSELQEIQLRNSGRIARGHLVVIAGSGEQASQLRENIRQLPGTVSVKRPDEQ